MSSKTELAPKCKTGRLFIAGRADEFRDGTEAALYGEVVAAQVRFLAAYRAWLVQARPTQEQVNDLTTTLASAMTQITMVEMGGPRHGR